MTTGIYTITNLINNKIYVGRASDIYKRMSSHLQDLRYNTHYNEHLQRSYNEYGEDNFKFELLIECKKELLCSEEHYWATMLNTHDKNYGYNIAPTHPYGKTINSEETRKKLSIVNTGKRHSEETKKILSVINTGKKHSEETKLKISLGNKGKKFTDKQRQYYSLIATGRKHTEETKLKLSILKTGIKHTKETIIKKRDTSLCKIVLQYDLNGNFIKEYKSASEVQRITGYSGSFISKCCRGERKISCGYIWKYK